MDGAAREIGRAVASRFTEYDRLSLHAEKVCEFSSAGNEYILCSVKALASDRIPPYPMSRLKRIL